MTVAADRTMSRFPRSTYFTAACVALLVACGGSVTSIDDGRDTGDDDDGTGKGGGGDSSCSVSDVAGDRACVPGFAKANTALTIDLDATEGCLGCFTTLRPCKVSVNGDEISVGMEASVCKPAGDQACPAVCGLAKVSCSIPPLAAGTYTIKVAGEPSTLPRSRELVVSDDASAETSCSLDYPGTQPEPIDVDKLPKTCSNDDDCVAVVSSPCGACGCNDAAIATSAKTDFDAVWRARFSQCKPPSAQVACAPCEPAMAHCKIDNNAATGRCELTHGSL